MKERKTVILYRYFSSNSFRLQMYAYIECKVSLWRARQIIRTWINVLVIKGNLKHIENKKNNNNDNDNDYDYDYDKDKDNDNDNDNNNNNNNNLINQIALWKSVLEQYFTSLFFVREKPEELRMRIKTNEWSSYMQRCLIWEDYNVLKWYRRQEVSNWIGLSSVWVVSNIQK